MPVECHAINSMSEEENSYVETQEVLCMKLTLGLSDDDDCDMAVELPLD